MAIGVRFPEGGASPFDVIQQLATRATGEYAKEVDARIRLLLDSGVRVERISIVTFADCAECRGAGTVVEQELREASHILTIRECSTCPGISVDGKSIRSKVDR